MKKNTDLTIVNWKIEDAIANGCNVSSDKANRVMQLLNDGSTIPFIARYRKECTGNLSPKTLNKIKDKMEECKNVIEQVSKSMKVIEKSGLLNDEVKLALKCCKTIEDVEFVTEPFKTKGPKSLANRARQSGLEPFAMKILFDKKFFDLRNNIPTEILEEFKSMGKVEEAIKNIIADIFAKNVALFDGDRKLKNYYKSTELQSRLTKTYLSIDQDPNIDEDTRKTVLKLKAYHNFDKSISRLLSHQIMAINRGEKNKILKVSIQLPISIQEAFIEMCKKQYLVNMCKKFYPFVDECAADAYKRLVQPYLIRKIRNELKKKAKIESLDVFETNLRHLVMSGPLLGVSILGIDPGKDKGCKIAVIDKNSQLIESNIIYLHRSSQEVSVAKTVFINLVLNNQIEYIAIGDGCGSAKAAKFVSSLIASRVFGKLNVRFVIVRECGASVWSITEESQKEFPKIDATIRSAVSIARRLQDPLAEYVKMDPKSLGVGMYQHDLSEKSLTAKVNAMLDECISFTGVDINNAPSHILQHVSGLGPAKAKTIIEYREKNGYFRNRRQLLNVSGIGEAIFMQCAGFIRVKSNNRDFKDFVSDCPDDKENLKKNSRKRLAKTADAPDAPPLKARKNKVDSDAVNPLDQTSIHPESYVIANRIIESLNLDVASVGTDKMQHTMKTFKAKANYIDTLSSFKTESCGIETLQDIITSLSQPLEFDERNNFCSSLLRQSYGSSRDLRVRQSVTGVVSNVTTFGMFIDIGVEISAFCYKLNSGVVLGDTIEGVVTFIGNDKLSIDDIRKVSP